MNATLLSIIPKAPRIPSDLVTLLTYVAPQNRTQARRVALSAARECGVSLDGTTQAEEL